MGRTTRGAWVAISAFVALSGAAYAGTGVNDNVEGLQSLARQGIEHVQDLQGVLDDALAITNALNSDAKFQTDVIAAINIKDQAALGNLLRQRVSRSTFSLPTLDTTQSFRIEIKLGGRKGGNGVLICISSKRTCGPNSDEFASVTR